MSLLQALKVQPEPITVPFQYLQSVTAAVAEYEQRSAEWVEPEAALHDGAQPVYALAHIRVTAGKVHAFVPKPHHNAFSVRQTFAKSSGVVSAVTATRQPLISMVTGASAGVFSDGYIFL